MNYKTSEILQTFLNVLQIVENSFYQTGQIWAVRVRVRVRGRGGCEVSSNFETSCK